MDFFSIPVISLAINIVVVVVVPIVGWLLRATVTDRLLSLEKKIDQLEKTVHDQELSVALVVGTEVVRRVGQLEERVARVEGARG